MAGSQAPQAGPQPEQRVAAHVDVGISGLLPDGGPRVRHGASDAGLGRGVSGLGSMTQATGGRWRPASSRPKRYPAMPLGDSATGAAAGSASAGSASASPAGSGGVGMGRGGGVRQEAAAVRPDKRSLVPPRSMKGLDMRRIQQELDASDGTTGGTGAGDMPGATAGNLGNVSSAAGHGVARAHAIDATRSPVTGGNMSAGAGEKVRPIPRYATPSPAATSTPGGGLGGDSDLPPIPQPPLFDLEEEEEDGMGRSTGSPAEPALVTGSDKQGWSGAYRGDGDRPLPMGRFTLPVSPPGMPRYRFRGPDTVASCELFPCLHRSVPPVMCPYCY